jgi:predicted permease
MRSIRACFVRLTGLFRKQSRERDLAEEIESNLQLHVDDNLRAGMTTVDARREALLKFGGIEKTKEEYRDRRSIPMLETLVQDLRYGLRMLRRSPGFTAVAVLSLSLGIGANTAIFSVIDALMLKRLPVRHPEQLVTLRHTFQGRSDSASYHAYQRFRDITQFFSAVAAVCHVDRYNVTINPGNNWDPAQVRVGVATGDYFSTLGVNAALGRVFTPDDDRVPGGNPVTVISHSYWERKFARASDVVGRTLVLNGTTYTVLGVTPAGFSGEWVGRPTDFWLPMSMMPRVMIEWPPVIANDPNVQILGRLKPGAAIPAARAAADAIYKRLRREEAGPVASRQELQFIAQTGIEIEPAAMGFSPQRQMFAQPLAILMVVVGIVLLVACANMANLLLARSTARRREMAVRLAIGAGTARVIRQLLTESVLLAAIGGALGLIFARWGTNALSLFASSGPVRSNQSKLILDLHPDLPVMAFTAAVCLLTGILFGLAPALQASGVSISPALGTRGASSGSASGLFGFSKLLVAAQVALSLVLLIGGGLFLRTLRNLKAQDLGFDQEHLLLVWLSPGPTGRSGPAAASLYQAMEQRISSLPGIRSVSPSVYGLLQGNTNPGAFVTIAGYVPQSDADLRAEWSIVGSRYFDALGLPLTSGRNFTEHDSTTAPQVAILNESMARHFFGSEDPIGKQFESWGIAKVVVGVVKDAKYESPREVGRRMFYLPYRQQLHRLSQAMCLAVRTQGNPSAFAARVRQELHDIDPNLPVLRIETIQDQLDDLLVPERLIASLSGFFSALAVLLACLGLYGVMAYTTARRTNEIGIRLALGATRGGVLRMIFKESLLVVAVGGAIGLLMTLAITGLISAKLFGVSAADPITIAGATLLMTVVVALAAFLPAHRASRVDPMVALRNE